MARRRVGGMGWAMRCVYSFSFKYPDPFYDKLELDMRTKMADGSESQA